MQRMDISILLLAVNSTENALSFMIGLFIIELNKGICCTKEFFKDIIRITGKLITSFKTILCEYTLLKCLLAMLIVDGFSFIWWVWVTIGQNLIGLSSLAHFADSVRRFFEPRMPIHGNFPIRLGAIPFLSVFFDIPST